MSKYVVGNWKMNQSPALIETFFEGIKTPPNISVWLAPQFIHLPQCLSLAKSQGIQIGAQNCASAQQGAFTGEVSPRALQELGATFVLIGHSERRRWQQESSELCRQKIEAAFQAQLKVIYCVGEDQQEREEGRTEEVIRGQLEGALKPLRWMDQLLVAYEPVWAIGTGLAADPQQAAQVHQQIHSWLQEHGPDAPVLYGGSVKPQNFASFLACPGIDGGLIGGASLHCEDFSKLCASAAEFHR